MTIDRDGQAPDNYQGVNPVNRPKTILAYRDPTALDRRFPIGTPWVNRSSNQCWTLTNVAAGSANWAISSPGSSDVDTINSLSPTAGNIIIDGGTNITDVNAGSTITLNLDNAITLATSVTSPIYTAAAGLAINTVAGNDITMKMGDAAGANKISFTDSAAAEVAALDSDGTLTVVNMDGIIGATTPAAGAFTTVEASTSVTTPLYTAAAATDVQITAPTGQDVIIKLGDNAAANKLSLIDSDDLEVFSVDSNGVETYAGLTVAGAFVSNGGTVSLGTDNAANAIIVGGGTTARAITIGQDAAAHTIAIGQAAAGAITIDTAAGFSIDGATASNITVTGAGEDLSIQGAGGAVNITSTEGENDAILIEASAANGGVQIRAGTGGVLIGNEADCTGITLGLIAPTASRTITIGGGTVVTASVTDLIKIGPDGATTNADSIKQVDVNVGTVATGQLLTNIASGAVTSGTHTTSIASGNVAAGTVALNMSTGTGTKTVNVGNADGLTTVNIDGITLINDSINVATSINTGTSTGAVAIGNATAGTITVDSAALIEINAAAAGVVNICNDAVANTINIGTTDGASALNLFAGTGEISITGTVKEINAEFIQVSGDDVIFQSSPICLLSGNAPALPTGATGTVNLLGFPEMTMEQFVIGAGQTIIAPVMDATGLLVSGDLTATEGFEYNFGAALDTSRHAFTIGTDAAFFLEWKFTVADVSGCEPCMIGFRKTEVNNATVTAYTDYAMIGLDAVASVGNVVIKTELNSGGTTNTNTTDAWGDGESHTLQVLVSAAGVVTYTIDGVAPSVTAAFTFDNGDVVAPFFRLTHGAGAPGTVHWETMKCGYQA